MQRFTPHNFTPSVKLLREIAPCVVITQQCYDKMYYIVKHNSKEVGWLCTVERDGYTFTLTDCFLYKQEVNSATTEISPEGITEVTMKLLAEPNGVDKVNKLRFWGHKKAA